MQNSFQWFPSWRSGFNAIALVSLMTGLQLAMIPLLLFLGWVQRWLPLPPPLWSLLGLIFFVFPIVAIAFLHHWLHRWLDKTFPDTRLPDDPLDNFGVVPGLVSWWEGFYGWAISRFAYTFCLYLLILFKPASGWTRVSIAQFGLSQFGIPQVSALLSWSDLITPEAILLLVLQMAVVAFLYQFEYQMRLHLMAAGRTGI